MKSGDIGLLVATASTVGYLVWTKWMGGEKTEAGSGWWG
jgi:hypothetical protein